MPVSFSSIKLGATGFEPATSRPPAVRATKLRHTPVINTIPKLPGKINHILLEVLV